MDEKLLDLSTKELLKKFGSGNHKPGSGSAAALQGMLSAQLIRTVIDLTNEEKRRAKYVHSLPELLQIYKDIENRIYPQLEKLFQEDSTQFGKAIELRVARDKEADPKVRQSLGQQALQALVPATQLPIEIAKLCLELGHSASIVFENGFKSARGDSAVALNGASSAVGGCLSIIELNLLSFVPNDWTRRIRLEIGELKYDYENLISKSQECSRSLEEESREKSFALEIEQIRSVHWTDLRLTHAQIEEVAKQIQNVLWEYRGKFWEKKIPERHLDVLRPEIALEKLLDYKFGYAKLGRHITDSDEAVEVAGQIDKKNKVVLVSQEFPEDVQNFTIAHELGHALLHKGLVLHRDRGLDGSTSNRDFREIQADKFATYFLMPTKQVKIIFQELFIAEKFAITNNTVFALGEGRVSDFQKRVKNRRGLARYLAQAEYFQGKSFRSISEIFKVSVGAMAIRLEELDLIEFP